MMVLSLGQCLRATSSQPVIIALMWANTVWPVVVRIDVDEEEGRDDVGPQGVGHRNGLEAEYSVKTEAGPVAVEQVEQPEPQIRGEMKASRAR
jgi:hypothetical protein